MARHPEAGDSTAGTRMTQSREYSLSTAQIPTGYSPATALQHHFRVLASSVPSHHSGMASICTRTSSKLGLELWLGIKSMEAQGEYQLGTRVRLGARAFQAIGGAGDLKDPLEHRWDHVPRRLLPPTRTPPSTTVLLCLMAPRRSGEAHSAARSPRPKFARGHPSFLRFSKFIG